MEKSKTEQMKQIRDEVFNLSNSPLYTYRTENNYYPVIGEGSHDADIMFIGEAPGKNEAMTGRPFCGAAGKILDELLASIGIDRKEVYITNILKDRPPDNRDPLPAEVELYAPFLDRQIETIAPKAIIPLGRHAMSYIMKKYNLDAMIEPISQSHGKMHDATTLFGTIKIVLMYHPAAAIYTRALKDTLLEDFKTLRELI